MSPIIVAEIAASHNGSLERALETITAAKACGADAVKFQTFSPESMVVDRSYVIEGGQWSGHNLYDLYEKAYTPRDWHPAIFSHAESLGLAAFSTPFSASDVDFLERFDPPWYKIASFELVDLPLIRYAARTGKQIILSTGMASRAEVLDAISAAFYLPSSRPPIVLNCISAYPASAATAAFDNYGQSEWGVSDHSRGWMVPVCATARHATMIEKHLTLERAGGLDDGFAMLPSQFREMVGHVREAALCVDVSEEKTQLRRLSEEPSKRLRRSLYFARNLKAGHKITAEDLISARPALGASPAMFDLLIGCRLARDVERHSPVMVTVDTDGFRAYD